MYDDFFNAAITILNSTYPPVIYFPEKFKQKKIRGRKVQVAITKGKEASDSYKYNAICIYIFCKGKNNSFKFWSVWAASAGGWQLEWPISKAQQRRVLWWSHVCVCVICDVPALNIKNRNPPTNVKGIFNTLQIFLGFCHFKGQINQNETHGHLYLNCYMSHVFGSINSSLSYVIKL